MHKFVDKAVKEKQLKPMPMKCVESFTVMCLRFHEEEKAWDKSLLSLPKK